MNNYRVDFKILATNPKQNRNVFTFALADCPEQACAAVRKHHGLIEINKVEKVDR